MILYILCYIWSALTVIPGLILLAAAALTNSVEDYHWQGPALLVRLQGRVAAWAGAVRNGRYWYGTTVGLCVFLYHDPTPQAIRHEEEHVWQQMILGPLYVPIYVGSYLYGLVKYRSFHEAYRHCTFEAAARRVAGEE